MNIINNILNSFNLINNKDISLSKAILFFYLFIASNYIKDLYAGQLKDYIKQNRFAQHVIGFITMIIIIINIGKVKEPKNAVFYATISYIIFVLSTKLDLEWNIAIVILLTIGYIYETKMYNKETESYNDQSLEDKDKDKIKNSNKRMMSLIINSILIIIAIGVFRYVNKKQIQYGGNFDEVTFLFNGRAKIIN